MAYYVRTVYNLILGMFSKIKSPTDDYVWRSRCGLFDIDMFLHMNHAQYFAVCEQARWAWTSASGLLSYLRSNKLSPVVTTIAARYRRPIFFWKKYEITCKMIHMDEKAFYVHHTIYSPDHKTFYAGVLVKLQVHKKNEIISPIEVFKGVYPNCSIPTADQVSPVSDGLLSFHNLESFLLNKPINPAASPSPYLASSPSLPTSSSSPDSSSSSDSISSLPSSSNNVTDASKLLENK